jgi:hypothetical protein
MEDGGDAGIHWVRKTGDCLPSSDPSASCVLLGVVEQSSCGGGQQSWKDEIISRS